MKKELVNKLKCPECGAMDFGVVATGGEEAGVMDGALTCRGCGAETPVSGGIVCFRIHDEKVLREKAQWEVFAGSEGWLESDVRYLESLPSSGANLLKKNDTLNWGVHEWNFFNVLRALGVQGMEVLDLGAGRCWSSRWITLAGGRVTALDAMEHKTLGLGAGDVFMQGGDIYFERVAGDFNTLPFRDESFDAVFISGALHHSPAPEKTISEIARVLRPGGMVALANEPVSNFRAYEEPVVGSVEQEGINEFSYRVTRLLGLFAKNALHMRHVFENISVYDRSSPYYQGVLAALINRTPAGRLFVMKIKGGVLNCILQKKK
jgi:ubiquinone/menaquinone biosynthesis C-methylase UbiE